MMMMMMVVVVVMVVIQYDWASFVAGIMIATLAFLYIVKSCADCRCVGGKKYVRRKQKQTSQPDGEKPALPPTGAGDAR